MRSDCSDHIRKVVWVAYGHDFFFLSNVCPNVSWATLRTAYLTDVKLQVALPIQAVFVFLNISIFKRISRVTETTQSESCVFGYHRTVGDEIGVFVTVLCTA